MVKFVVAVPELGGQTFRYGMVPVSDRDAENMSFAVITLFSPTAGNDMLKLFIELAAAGEGGRSVMVNKQPLAAGDGFRKRLSVII